MFRRKAMTNVKCKLMIGLFLAVAIATAPAPILADYHETKITADDAAAFDYFGTSVSISGDYAVVGASHDDGHVASYE